MNTTVDTLKKLAVELKVICEIKQIYLDKSYTDNKYFEDGDKKVQFCMLPYDSPEEQKIIDETREKLAKLYDSYTKQTIEQIKQA